MNILQLITPSKIAGAERSTTSLCEHLQAAGHRVVVGCKAGSPLIEAMRQVSLDARPLAISGKLNVAAPFRVAALAKQVGAEVIHSQLSTAAIHGSIAARMLGVPSIAHVRALNTPFCYQFSTRVIAVSHAVKAHLVAKGLPEARIDVVYNGVDPERYFLPCTREEARRRLGFPEGVPLIGVIAHLTAKKGHAVFLQAFAEVAARYPRTQAVFLGDGPERERLEALAAELKLADRVVFAGFHANVLPYYASLDLVILPSVAGEGLPRALLEGGMLRRATIGTRLSGSPEIVRDGETGFIVPPGDVNALSQRLDMLLGDASLRERMGAAAHEFVSATFTVEAMVSGVLASYKRAGARSCSQ